MKLLASILVWSGLAAAHFELLYPPSIGFSDDSEGKAPCGGFTPDFSKNVVDFHVGGEALAMRLAHQQCNWLFRATTDQTAASGWEPLFPIVMQTGLGDFCEPRVTAPPSFAGKKGVVSVVSSATDGLLYQCVAVNFVDGSADAPSECKNATIKATFASDAKLSALVGTAGDSTSTGTSTGAATTAAATSMGAAAAVTRPSSAGFGWGCAAAMAALGALGGALVL